MSSAAARPLLVSTDNYSSLISIIAWVFLVTTFLGVVARLSTRVAIARRFKTDDLLIVVALTLSIGYAVSLSMEAVNGLGRHMSSLDEGQLQKVHQLNYASAFLYAGTLSCTKLSVVALLWSISPKALHRRWCFAIGVLVTIWTVTSVFVIAFQCQIPKTWELNGKKCISEIAFWSYFETVNIITDLMLILLPLSIVWVLQARKARKAIIFGCFAVRILVVPTAVIRIVYLTKVSNTGDFTLRAWPAALCALIEESLSVIAACIPYLKPFLDSLESGMMNNDQLRREGLTELYGHTKSRATRSQEAKEVSPKNHRAKSEDYLELGSVSNDNDKDDGVYSGPGVPSRSVDVSTESHVLGTDLNHEWDSKSQTSQTKFIRKSTNLTLTNTLQAPAGRPLQIG